MNSKIIVLGLFARVAAAQEAPAQEAPAPVTAPVPAVVEQPVVVSPPPAPPPAPAPASRELSRVDPGHHGAPGERDGFVALEVGAGNFADGNNIYNRGLGHGFIAGLGDFEFQFASFDLSDRSDQFTNVAHADGIATITSLAYRVGLFKSRVVSVSGLVGLAVLTRPSMIQIEPDDPDLAGFGNTNDYEPTAQWGVGAVLGGGVTLFQYLYADVRLYPTAWSGIAGTRYELADGATTTTTTMITKDSSPGGMPITFDVGIGYGF